MRLIGAIRPTTYRNDPSLNRVPLGCDGVQTGVATRSGFDAI